MKNWEVRERTDKQWIITCNGYHVDPGAYYTDYAIDSYATEDEALRIMNELIKDDF